VGEQPVGQHPAQRRAKGSQAPMLLGHTGGRLFVGVGALPVAAPRVVGAIRAKAVARAGAVLTIQVSVGAT
jgi:hypothetical protein